MKAQLVKENIDFKRGQDSKRSLEVGYKRKIYPPYNFEILPYGYYLGSIAMTTVGPIVLSTGVIPFHYDIFKIGEKEIYQVTEYVTENALFSKYNNQPPEKSIVYSAELGSGQQSGAVDEMDSQDYIQYIGDLDQDYKVLVKKLDLGFEWIINDMDALSSLIEEEGKEYY